jgi:hypothetical protein
MILKMSLALNSISTTYNIKSHLQGISSTGYFLYRVFTPYSILSKSDLGSPVSELYVNNS